MTADPPGAVTALLRRAGAGAPRAADQLFALVYDELRRLAASVRRGRAGDTLSSTALVHEAYLKLVPPVRAGRRPTWDRDPRRAPPRRPRALLRARGAHHAPGARGRGT